MGNDSASYYKFKMSGTGVSSSAKTVSFKVSAISETTEPEAVSIAYDAAYDYLFVNLSTKQAVSVAPVKDSWDILATKYMVQYTEDTAMAVNGILINTIGGVKAYMVNQK